MQRAASVLTLFAVVLFIGATAPQAGSILDQCSDPSGTCGSFDPPAGSGIPRLIGATAQLMIPSMWSFPFRYPGRG